MSDLVSRHLQAICMEKKKSCYQLSRDTGISTSSLYNILNGKASPKINTLEEICKALDITVGELFMDTEKIRLPATKRSYVFDETKTIDKKIMMLNIKNRSILEDILDLLLKYQQDECI